ncbi:MAG: MFS transporter [Chloroflexota bacterium]
MGRLYYGWVMLFSIALMTFASSGSRFSFGVFLVPMSEDLHWGRDQLALAASVNLILAGLLRAVVGFGVDRYGSKAVVITGVFLCGVSLLLTSVARELWQFYLAYGVLLAIGFAFASPVVVTTVVSKWFVKRRSLAMSIGSTGAALGQLVTVPMAMLAVITVGYENAYRVIGLFMLLIVMPVGYFLFFDKPSDKGLEPYGAEAGDAKRRAAAGNLGMTLKEAMRNPDIWKLTVGFFACGFTMSFASTHFIAFAEDMDIEPMAAANALGIVGACSLVGGVTAGYLGDRFSRKNVLACVYLLRGLSFIVMLQANGLAALYLASFILGISWTSTGPLTSAITADKVGLKNLGSIFGTMYTIMPIGTGVGAYLAGAIYESRHSYELSLILSAAIGLIAAVMVFGVREPDRGSSKGKDERQPQPQPVLVPSLAGGEQAR